MKTTSAQLKNLRIAPRKTRLLAGLIKGKSADEAVEILRFTTKRAAEPVRKLIQSAQANARERGLTGELYVRSITVNDGLTLFRRRPAAQGQLKIIRKRNSHVFVELEAREEQKRAPASKKKPAAAAKTAAKRAPAATAKQS
ncbi:MAG: 50S ribosomal protein L22 [Candidatus Paceibacterota bacterium]